MSTASISYSSLHDAAGEARDVARKLDRYADSINSSVYTKLDSYEGSWTGNITSARSKANAKISELRTEAGKYRDYANDLEDLKRECESVDTAVKSKVSSLTASFKAAHGINNNVVINTISYFFTSIGNSSKAGRWINEKTDQIDSGIDYLKQRIEDWYDYNGGKEFLKGLVEILIDVALAIATVLALGSISGIFAAVAAVAAVAGALMTAFNSGINLGAELDALGYADDDPATARRKNDVNSFSDFLRVVSDSETLHGIADAWDGVKFACDVIGIIKGGVDLVKNAGKLFNSIKNINSAFRAGGASWLDSLKGDILHNLKQEFWNFTDANGLPSISDGAKSVKNILEVPKSLLDNKPWEAIAKVVLPALTLNSWEGEEITGLEVGSGGQIQFDFTDRVNFSDIFGKMYDIWDKGGKILDYFSDDAQVNINIDEIRAKFGESQPIDVSVPPIIFPKINVGYTQVV